MEEIMKKFGIMLLTAVLLITFNGCPEADGELSVKNPVTGVVIERAGFPDITQNDFSIEMTEGQSLFLTVKKSAGGTPSWFYWEIEEGAEYISITGDNDKAAVEISADNPGHGNYAIIKASAGNKDGNASLKVKIDVIPNSDLKLEIDNNGVGEWNNGKTELTIKNNDELILGVTGTVDETEVVLKNIIWEVLESENIILSINENTGAVTVIGIGSNDIKVTAATDGVNKTAEKIISVIVIDSVENNILFMWNADIATGNMTNGGSVPPFTMPTNISDQFMRQKDGMIIKSFRVFGSGTITPNVKGLPLGGANNLRLAIGQYGNVGTAQGTGGNPPAHSPDMSPIPDYGGEIDLYRKFVRLTIHYADALSTSTTSGYILRAYVGNNGTGEGNSIFGAASNLGTYSTGEFISGSQMEILNASEGNI